jgi:hypothetical protein
VSEIKPVEPLRIDERLMILGGYLITSGMMACLAASMVQFGELAQPSWNGAYLVILGFLVALEALYSHRLLRNLFFTDPKYIGYRVSEWVVILIVLKFVQIINSDGLSIFSTILSWQQNFSESFFNNETIFAGVTLLIVWLISSRFAGYLNDLEANQRVLQQEMESGIYENRTAIRERLANLIILVGAGMVVFSALMRVDMMARWFELPALRVGVLNTILYFFLGLVLLSLTQFNLLRARWYRDSLPVRKEIASRWIVYSLVFILGLALIARLLPTGYTVGLLTVLNYLFFAIAAIINFIITVLLLPIFWLLGWFASLFAGSGASETPASLPTITELPVLPQTEPIPLWELIKSILFWLVFLSVIGFALVYYFKENKEMLANLRKIPFFSSIARFFDWLGNWLQGVNRQIGEIVDTGWQRLLARRDRTIADPPWRFVNPNRLPPRERVRFFYLAMVRRGGERGYDRHPAQTPLEYSDSLAEALVSTGPADMDDVDSKRDRQPLDDEIFSEDIDVMTDKFIMARYSRQPISENDANLVERAWGHLRRVLGKTKRRKEQM